MRLEGGFAELTLTKPADRLDDPDQDHQIGDPDEVEERTRDGRAEKGGCLLQVRRIARNLTGERPHPEGKQHHQDEDNRRVS